MQTYYKVIITDKDSKECKYSLSNGSRCLTYNQITLELESIIKTHKTSGFWSCNPHDWGKCEVNVKVIKCTEEEL